LHRRLWVDTFVSEATLVGLVKEIRRAFGDGGLLIRTSHGVGYAFSGEVAVQRSPRPTSGQPDSGHWVVASDRRIALKWGENVIGRDATSDVAINLAGVSRRHARILVSADGVLLQDLGSKNGTTVRGLACLETASLNDGETIRLGPASIVFRAADANLSTEAMDPGAMERADTGPPQD
jgi:hypothetical protein